MNKIRNASLITIAAALATAGCTSTHQAPVTWTEGGIPISGEINEAFADFDRTMVEILEAHDVPGATVAIGVDGRMVMAHGYGWGCEEKGEIVQPNSLFRIASVSKPITAVAVMKLVEEGRLSLEDRAFEILDDLEPIGGEIIDQRIYDITIRNLLEHSAGWHRGMSFDPMYSSLIARYLPDEFLPPTCETTARFMLSRSLDFDPGTRHAYSNLGYCVLSLVIEEVTDQEYETYVREQVLAPMGIGEMRVGGSLLEDRYPEEVCYYDDSNASQGLSVFPDGPTLVPQPYGAFSMDAGRASGGWIASAIDLMKFLFAVDGQPSPPDVLEPESIQIMHARPDLPDWQNTDSFYALGWEFNVVEGRDAWSHNGAMPGTHSLIGWTSDGFYAAFMFNSDPRDGSDMENEVVAALIKLIQSDTDWPQEDLMARYSRED